MFKNILPFNSNITSAFSGLNFSETISSTMKGLASTKAAQVAGEKISSFSSLFGAHLLSAKEAYQTASFSAITDSVKAKLADTAGVLTSGFGSLTHGGYKVYKVGSFLWNWGPSLVALGVVSYVTWQCFISYRSSKHLPAINVHLHPEGRDLTITSKGNSLTVTHHTSRLA